MCYQPIFHVVPSSVHNDLRKGFTLLWSLRAKHLNGVYLCGQKKGDTMAERLECCSGSRACSCISGVSSVKHLRSSW